MVTPSAVCSKKHSNYFLTIFIHTTSAAILLAINFEKKCSCSLHTSYDKHNVEMSLV